MQTSDLQANAYDGTNNDDNLVGVYDSEEESYTVMEEIAEEVSQLQEPYDYEEGGGVSIGSALGDDDSSNHVPRI